MTKTTTTCDHCGKEIPEHAGRYILRCTIFEDERYDFCNAQCMIYQTVKMWPHLITRKP